MSSRPIFSPYQVLTSGDMSQAVIHSAVTIIQNLSMVSYDISWTGSTPIGVLTVEISNTYNQNADGTVKNAGNWTPLTLSQVVNVSGNTGGAFIDVESIAGYAIRLTYTRTSGTGSMNATVNGKVT